MAIFNMCGGGVPQDYIVDTGELNFTYERAYVEFKAPDEAKQLVCIHIVNESAFNSDWSIDWYTYPSTTNNYATVVYELDNSGYIGGVYNSQELVNGKLSITTSNSGGDTYSFSGKYHYYIIYKTK